MKIEEVRILLANHLDGKQILITGSTGFVGRSILEEVIQLNDSFGCQIGVTAVVRNNAKAKSMACLQAPFVSVVVSEIGLPIPWSPRIDFILHCATPASAYLNVSNPQKMLSLNVDAANWILDFAKRTETTPKLLFTSSGAVYGPQPGEQDFLPEDVRDEDSFLPTMSAYASGKRLAEKMFKEAGVQGIVHPVIARLFAFSGRALPLDQHFAIGNFVRDAAFRDFIEVRGSGNDIRSYLDASDMALWLLMATCSDIDLPHIHIGSQKPISIKDLALTVQSRMEILTNKRVPVRIENLRSAYDGSSRYVPSTELTRQNLNVEEWTNLELSIDQMLRAVLPTV